jgi:hypothetical protein
MSRFLRAVSATWKEEDNEFWDTFGSGEVPAADANSLGSKDASSIFWPIKQVN